MWWCIWYQQVGRTGLGVTRRPFLHSAVVHRLVGRGRALGLFGQPDLHNDVVNRLLRRVGVVTCVFYGETNRDRV